MSRSPSPAGLALGTLLAAALLGVGAALAVRPALVLERAPGLEELLAAVDPGTVVLALVVLLVLFAPTLGIVGRLRSPSTTPLVDAGDDGPALPWLEDDGPAVVGERFDRRIAVATAYDDEPRSRRESAREELVDSLRPIAATAYANRAGLTDDEATAAIEDGAWTDDPRAAAFLAGPDGPSTPLWLWLLDLVSTADPFLQSLERTLVEIDRVQSTPAVGASAADARPAPEAEPEVGA